MKKTILAALVIMASASLSTANAAKKEKKKTVEPVALNSTADSLSYAAGIEATRGLIDYLQQSYKVDTAYMADFVRGFQEAVKIAKTPQGNAYIAGLQIAQLVEQRIVPSAKQEIKSTNLPLNEDVFNKGFAAALTNDTAVFNVQSAVDYKKHMLAGQGEKWLAENAKKPGVKTTNSGLQYKVLVAGNGPVPKVSDEVEVVYEGRLIDGTVFDATSRHGSESDKFKAGNLIKGWTEALTLMPVGSKWELYIPQELAYGEREAGQIPPYSTLIFTLELKSIVEPQVKETPAETKEAPAEVKKAPAKNVSATKKSARKK